MKPLTFIIGSLIGLFLDSIVIALLYGAIGLVEWNPNIVEWGIISRAIFATITFLFVSFALAHKYNKLKEQMEYW